MLIGVINLNCQLKVGQTGEQLRTSFVSYAATLIWNLDFTVITESCTFFNNNPIASFYPLNVRLHSVENGK